jgi:succinoglycan biosynthesis protein ExoU
MKPGVSIIIAAYNAGPTIGRAIASALAEPEVSEVIVVDDSSTDNTVTAAQAADDGSHRLKILIQPQNTGPAAARNRAIVESRAPWIGILDADDYFVPGRMKRFMALTNKSDMLADNMMQVEEAKPDLPPKKLLKVSFNKPRLITFEDFVCSNVTVRGRQRAELGFIKPLIKRSFLADHNIRYQETLRLGEDYELYARALAYGARLLLLPEAGYVSVVRQNSISGRHSVEDLLNLRNCDRDLKNIPNLSRQAKEALRAHFLSMDCRLQWRLLINAVKDRKALDAIKTFLHPFPVPLYLLWQLLNQVWIRSLRALKIKAFH